MLTLYYCCTKFKIFCTRSYVYICDTTVANAQAELLSQSIMFRLPSGKKLCISTFYRVGTLGIENFTKFCNHFKLLASKNRIDKHILIGDLNLNNVLWPHGHTNCCLQKSFVDFLINDLSHTQLISSPTHTAGNILDLMFTNIPLHSKPPLANKMLKNNTKTRDQAGRCRRIGYI